jgi:phage recombination protein Bet
MSKAGTKRAKKSTRGGVTDPPKALQPASTDIVVPPPQAGSSAMTLRRDTFVALSQRSYTEEQIALIKSTIAPGLEDNEFALFMYMAKSRGLDPLQKQIYAIKRNTWDGDADNGRGGKGAYVSRMTIQNAIDGLRAIANRTGLYMPSEKIPLVEGQGGKDFRVTVWLKKFSPNDHQWHEFGATAYYREFVQLKKEKNNEWVPVSMWAKMEINQLEKCAEAKALRRGWPEELGQMYVPEEFIGRDAEAREVAKRETVAEQKQDKATLEVGTLTPSAQQNRGHDKEGLQETTSAPAAPAADPAPAEAPKKKEEKKRDSFKLPSGSQKTVGLMIREIVPKMKGESPYMILKTLDDKRREFILYVFDTKLHEACARGLNKVVIFWAHESKGTTKSFMNADDIVSINGKPWMRSEVDGVSRAVVQENLGL